MNNNPYPKYVRNTVAIPVQRPAEQPPVLAELNCVCGAVWEWRNRDWELIESPQPADYDQGWKDGYKHGAWASEQQPTDAPPSKFGGPELQALILDKALEQQPAAPVIDESAAKRICTVLGWKPAAQWVGLTRDQVQELFWSWSQSTEYKISLFEFRYVYSIIDAKLREKNGGKA